MAYIGRIVGVGETVDENPVLLYGLSGRSPSSRARTATIYGGRVAIEPSGDLTPEQAAEAQRLIYDAIMVSNFFKFGVVSNGKQTDDMFKKIKSNQLKCMVPLVSAYDEACLIDGVLRKWGHEGKVGDRYNTPRISGAAEAHDTGFKVLGIITDKNQDASELSAHLNVRKGTAQYVSTYSGQGAEPAAPEFKDVFDLAYRSEFRILGETAYDLAAEMYRFMDPDFVVSSAAALWVPSKKKWELAVRNKPLI